MVSFPSILVKFIVQFLFQVGLGMVRVWVGSDQVLDLHPKFLLDPDSDPDPKGLEKLDQDPLRSTRSRVQVQGLAYSFIFPQFSIFLIFLDFRYCL